MAQAIHHEMLWTEVTADPYSYFGRLREEDPVHWNSKYAVWIVTDYDDVTHLTRHPGLFSSASWKNDPSL